MKAILIVLGLTVTAMPAISQDATVKAMQATTNTAIKITDTLADKNGWIKGGLFSLNLTQVSNSNWIAAGGEKFSFSIASALNLYATRSWGRNKWENVLDMNYGLINTTSLGVRKVNDRVDFFSKYGYSPANWKNVSLASLLQFRSQLTSGYEYNYFGSTVKRRNSGIFAPAYITFAPIGIDWHPKEWFSVYVSPVVARWTLTTNDPYSYVSPNGVFNGNLETPLATLYGVDPAKKTRGEFGAFLTATLKKEIAKNVNYYSKLDLYSNYLKNPQNVDLFWTNQVKMKVNNWLQVSYTLDLLYDDDVRQKQVTPGVVPESVGLQVLSTLGVGFAVKL
ncbi:MAG: DUF3078 domain-containing protein [Bacteroidota bacterium]